MRDAMVGRAAICAGLDDCGARGFADVRRAGESGGGPNTRGAGGRANFGGKGKPPTARARVGLVGGGGRLKLDSFDLVTRSRGHLLVPSP